MSTSTSLHVLRAHIKYTEDGSLDASGVISTACYEAWIATRKHSNVQATTYYRVLTNHLSGVDGRTPFEPDEEIAILQVLRKRLPWPCFPSSMDYLGLRFRTKGYHEKRLRSQQLVVKCTPSSSFMSFTSLDNASEILRMLPAPHALYVKELADTVALNFSSTMDWQSICQILRFMVFAKTSKCSSLLFSSKDEALRAAAEQLCLKYSMDANMSTAVLDLTAKTSTQCILAQNQQSKRQYGQIKGRSEHNSNGSDRGDLHRIVVAIAAAYHQPGTIFHVYQQRIYRNNRLGKPRDVYYCVDPATLLLVVFGK